MKVALIQTGLEVSFNSKAENLTQVLKLVNTTSAELMLFPEMWPCGYASFERYKADAEPLDGPLVTALRAAAKNRGVWLMPGSFPEQKDGKLYNTTMLISPQGEIAGVYRKIHVFGYKSREKELVAKGPAPAIVSTPFGQVGLAICYDLRFPELFRYYAKNGVQIFLVAASWPNDRRYAWDLFVKARAHENMCWMLAVNSHAHSLAVAPTGEIAAQGPNKRDTITVDIDLDLARTTRADFPVLNDAHWCF